MCGLNRSDRDPTGAKSSPRLAFCRSQQLCLEIERSDLISGSVQAFNPRLRSRADQDIRGSDSRRAVNR